MPGRSPHGERGLKSRLSEIRVEQRGRSPHGERGLKFEFRARLGDHALVALLMESVD